MKIRSTARSPSLLGKISELPKARRASGAARNCARTIPRCFPPRQVAAARSRSRARSTKIASNGECAASAIPASPCHGVPYICMRPFSWRKMMRSSLRHARRLVLRPQPRRSALPRSRMPCKQHASPVRRDHSAAMNFHALAHSQAVNPQKLVQRILQRVQRLIGGEIFARQLDAPGLEIRRHRGLLVRQRADEFRGEAESNSLRNCETTSTARWNQTPSSPGSCIKSRRQSQPRIPGRTFRR